MLLSLLAGCTVKVEPLAKPKPQVVYVYPKHHKHHHHAHPSPSPIGHLQPADDEIKLLPKLPPAPTPSP
jgi:hypothetical protein